MTRVLIVDDNASIVRVTRIVLEKSGYQVESADDERLFALAETWAPAVVLMDVHLPRLDGVEACRRLKQNPRTASTPVVLMTGEQGADELVAEAGADGILTKPFSRDELLETIERVATIDGAKD